MGSASALCLHIPLAKKFSSTLRANLFIRSSSSPRKGLDPTNKVQIVISGRNLAEKVLIGWTVGRSKSLQIYAKLRKGGKSGHNGDNKSRHGNPFSNGSSGSRSPVPLDQQPVNEYQNLVDSVLFSWAVGDLWLYALKLSAIGAVVALLLGWPIMATSMNPAKEIFKCGTGALCGGLLAVTLAALRMYLGWAYVGNRLLSATVEYEETGWYDGEIWIKSPEVLARDRLLGSYKVKPALNRVKLTLIGLAASLASCTLLLFTLQGTEGDTPTVQKDIVGSSPFMGTAYSEASARRYEPDAFGSENDSILPDYRHWLEKASSRPQK